MNIQQLKLKKTNYNHQAVLLSADGVVKESCNTIFETSPYLGKSLKSFCSFFESEFDTIMASGANKLTFEKIILNSESCSGYYDFIFSKCLNSADCLIWEIFDHTYIYNELVFLQQLQNEFALKNQFKHKKQKGNEQDSEFFKASFNQKSEGRASSSLEDLLKKRVDSFFSENDKAIAPTINLKDNSLHICANELVLKTNNFLKYLRNSEVEYENVQNLIETTTQPSFKTNQDVASLSMLSIDKRLVKTLLDILSLYKASGSSFNSLEVTSQNDEKNGSSQVVLTLQNESKTVLNATSTYLIMSSLDSLLKTVGGELKLILDSQNPVFDIKFIIPAH